MGKHTVDILQAELSDLGLPIYTGPIIKEHPKHAKPMEPLQPGRRAVFHPIVEKYDMREHFGPHTGEDDVLEELGITGMPGEFAHIKKKQQGVTRLTEIQSAREQAAIAYGRMYTAACLQARVEYDPRLPADRAGRMLASVQFGMSRYGAAALAGIPRRLFKDWEAKATMGGRFCEVLIGLIEIAEAHLEQAVIDKWMAQMGDSWQSAQAFAGRRLADRGWGERTIADLPWDQLQNMSEEELAGIVGSDIIDVSPTAQGADQGNGSRHAPVLSAAPDAAGLALGEAAGLLNKLMKAEVQQ